MLRHVPTTTPRSKLSWRRKVVFALMPLVVTLAVIEIGLRLFGPAEKLPRVIFVEPDADLIWRLKPTPAGPYQTNAHGFRDDELRLGADRKILLLGDSVTWGDGVLREHSYPFLLEGKLVAGDPGRSFEVINAGVPGYSTFQELALAQRLVPELRPDLIVLQFCLNDVVERYTTVAEYGGEGTFLGVDTRATVKGVYGWMLRHSRAFAWFGGVVQGLARDREAYDVRKLAQDPLGPELEAAWERTLAELDGIRRVAERHHVPFVLLVVPYLFQLEGLDVWSQPQRRLQAYATTHGVPIIDLLPQFVAERQRLLFKDESHLSLPGHEFTAQILAAALPALMPTGR